MIKLVFTSIGVCLDSSYAFSKLESLYAYSGGFAAKKAAGSLGGAVKNNFIVYDATTNSYTRVR